MTAFSENGKQALDNLIKGTLDSKKTPGFILGVSNTDGEIYFNGGGSRIQNDLGSGEVNPDSIFWICSQTKLITAVAGLKLIELGKLAFDTPVADYLPQLRDPVIADSVSTTKTTFRPAKNVLTVRHLFNFTSGLFYPQDEETVTTGSLHRGYYSKEVHVAEDPLDEWFNILKGDLPGVPLKFEPGTDFVYGWSSDVLGFVIEKASGQTLDQFFKEHIFKPLGMQSSFYLTPELEKRLVDLSWREKDGRLSPWSDQLPIIERDPVKLKLNLGGVGLYSSMRDYLKLLRHLLQINVGKPVVNPILTQESVHSIWVPALPEAGEKSIDEFVFLPFPHSLQWGTAMAINKEDWPNRRKKGVAYWGGYAGTEHFIDPANGIAVVFGVQILPWGDKEVAQTLFPKLEKLVYAALAN
ncbi:beta-lactamase [Gymnopilus junonius]|uniref:Beta-lactamase n=1 Tax=Gymnopilus junonius TaxID=109634 RepID=A0A9P5NR33_GYMJU|nr:beta-lactamase [Gymnopilus junonius]